MITHPLALALLALDALALLCLLVAAHSNLRALLGEDAASSAAPPATLAQPAAGATAARATRWALELLLAATALWVVAISNVLPGRLKGAICGAGVLEAMQGLGERTLAMHGAALLALWVWRTLDGLQRATPGASTVTALARWQLLALPFAVLAVYYGVRALGQLDPEQPLSCCQLVYGPSGPLRATRHTASNLAAGPWLGLLALSTLSLAVLALLRRARVPRASGARALPVATLLAALAWLPLTAQVWLRWVSVSGPGLQHGCLACLFLPKHHALGYPLYAALATIALESAAAQAAFRWGVSHPAQRDAADRRERRALLSVVLALALFVLLSAGLAGWRWAQGLRI